MPKIITTIVIILTFIGASMMAFVGLIIRTGGGGSYKNDQQVYMVGLVGLGLAILALVILIWGELKYRTK